MDDAETSLSADASASPRRLRVDVPSPFARMVLVPALPVSCAPSRDPAGLGVSDRKVDLIGENVDCVICGGELQDYARALRGGPAAGRMCLPGYLAMAGVLRHPGELEDSAPSHRGLSVARLGGAALCHAARRRTPAQHGRYALAVDDGNAYLQAGLEGLGILWLPDYMARAASGQRRAGAVVRGLGHGNDADVPGLSAQPPRQRQAARLHRLVVELMEAGVAPLPGGAGLGQEWRPMPELQA